MDLSLIKVFIVVYETKNISHAAEKLNLSQPSVTYNLNRLRKHLNNPLFERDKFGVKPTKLAQSLYPVFRKSVADIEIAIASSQQFDPLTSTKTFRLGLSDLGEICLLPALMQCLEQQAPLIKIEIEEIRSQHVEEWLIQGFLDVAVFNSSYTVMPKIESRNLFEERYMCVVNKAHPRIQHQLTLPQYLQEKHAAVKSSTGHIEIDQRLKEMGLKREIMLEVPHFSVLQDVVSSTALLITLPSRAARVYERNSQVNIFELPFLVKPFNVSVNWYKHQDDLEARTWFIQTIQESFQVL
ncbi:MULTISPECIES: LysR family transcriptional regulator [unclassified Acinetobacter]|uniref:LysR family transcriptional regulator n=1 Tax=unclassified Acinetobacter TaxID=196816 RepID=UPI002934F656|nr:MULTISPECIES: LysR family transcriptional regulator [unclassified Acinetobacter]WOE33074.1 LysR family transcriptional regulator [Acinetobacter sp. SAAs470]WOE39901.1 LysR family transcriptional regulator [Acinetobacter sp. SAAs474]